MTQAQKEKKEYLAEKTKYAYELYKQNKLFKKVRALIIKDNQLVVMSKKSNGYFLVGGGVEPNESLKYATRRESLEEANMVVFVKDLIGKAYYSVPMHYNGEDFISKRVEFFYVCNFLKMGNNEHMGLVGEFDEKTRVEIIPFEKLDKVFFEHKCKDKFKKYLKDNNLIS